jgi:hypothetical protein
MRRTVTIIFLCILAVSVTGCRKARVRSQLKGMMESTVVLPEKVSCVFGGEVFPMPDSLRNKAKLIIYIDTTECTTCRITHLGRYDGVYEMSREKGSFEVLFLLANTDLYGVPVTRYLADSPIRYPVYVDDDNRFPGLNPAIPKDPRFHIFLVDGAGTPVCAGDPSATESMFQVFLGAVDKLPPKANQERR